jgi:hypothetical protein
MIVVFGIFLLSFVAFAVVCLRTSYMLFRGRAHGVLNKYRTKGVTAAQLASIERSLAFLFLVTGCLFLASLVVIVALGIPFSNWVGFFVICFSVPFVDVSRIDRKYGFKID